MINWKEYRLRKAADAYWLIWAEQPGIPYVRPVMMNETGAEICSGLMEGKAIREIARQLGGREEAEEAEKDIRIFLEELEREMERNRE